VQLELLATGFDRPVLVLGHPREPDRLFVVEQGGSIKILEPGQGQAPPDDFLTVVPKNADATQIGPEMGLLGLAFHPDFPGDPRVFVNYNPEQGSTTLVEEYALDPGDADRVDPASARTVIQLHQPAGNHNGGMVTFGPDGYLYLGMGDGGGSNNEFDTAQDLDELLGKMVRIDPDPSGNADQDPLSCEGCPTYGPFEYQIPPDNPFVGQAGLDEIWAVGLRNPWRFSFDGDVLYIADVGQNQWEEIDIGAVGADYGWSDMEGNNCFDLAGCDTSGGPNETNADGYVIPIHQYSHQNGCSVTGGYVYRSCEVPAWAGVYFYSDFCAGDIRGLSWDGTDVMDLGSLVGSGEQVLGMGTNAWGDVFVGTVETTGFGEIVDGKVYRLVPG
jgi:glucose/arabinose dehydrogenase